ncbi:MAG: tRNA (guanosine(37)-N1)-methyltransferase TrmD [Pseudomonadales bacterium]|nr:tRNA (guanosine(37)-N1)-methyltransferase TrmD [Gammaproteobacteria bacterium]NNL56172.1 tRNA (guanosine(37)-N1)-methyltransferase TrmD [Pseudomonadales bacterium]
MRVSVVTLFPDMFAALTGSGITSRAIEQQLLQLDLINLRDYAGDKHSTVDDKPYGGGPGMVMSVAPLRAALAAARNSAAADAAPMAQPPKVVYLSPQGQPLRQPLVAQLASAASLVLLCGRYEGIDQRIIERDVDLEVSLGDYVISGGELAAMVLLDAMIRLQPGALGDEDSAAQDSFAGRGWLDCPHYTRPENIDGQQVPAVLLSGDHAAIARWRKRQALAKTLQVRPELLQPGGIELTAEELSLLEELREEMAQARK